MWIVREDAALVNAFENLLAIHFEHQSQRFFQILARFFERLALRDCAGNLFDEGDVAALFGRLKNCGERLRHGGEAYRILSPCDA